MTGDRWLRVTARARPEIRLLCLPYAGGGATVYRDWPRELPEHVEVCVAQLPGRQDRLGEPGLGRVDAIVDALDQALGRLTPLPLAIYGHSYGALLGYALARRLGRRAYPVRHLVAAARRPPQLPTPHRLHDLPERELLDAIHRHYGTSRALLDDADLMALVLPALRADLEAIETYVHREEPPLDLPITVLAARRDRVTPDEADGWGTLTRARFETHWIDADHFFVDTHRAWVIERVRAALSAR